MTAAPVEHAPVHTTLTKQSAFHRHFASAQEKIFDF